MPRQSRTNRRADLRPGLFGAARNAPPLKNPRKADQAYEQLKHLILSLELEPGQSIDERELMEQLDIGRTPLREAIQRLAHERLIRVEPRRGSWVTDLSLKELQDMMAARRLVEPAVAAIAAKRVTEKDIEELSRLAHARNQAVERGEISQAVYLDRDLHRQLAETSGNSFLAEIVDQINTAMLRYWHVSFHWGGDLDSTNARHQDLLGALKRHDPAAAAVAMEDHLMCSRSCMEGGLSRRLLPTLVENRDRGVENVSVVEKPTRLKLSKDNFAWITRATSSLNRRNFLRLAMGTGMLSISGGLLAACGGEDDDADSGSDGTTATATESTSETEAEETATEAETEESAAETEEETAEETEAAASPSEEEAESTSTDEDMANCQVGGTLVYALSSDPPDMDPQVSTGGAAESVKVQIYTGLLTYAPDASIIPELAEKWEVSDDGLGYHFDLRQDVVFHDGTPFTSADAKASYERILDPAVAASNFSYFSVIGAINTPDDYTMELELSDPSAPLPTYMANEYALILSKDFLDAGGDPNTESIGTGPFKLDSHEAGVRISVVKNEDFYGDVPELDRVDLIPYADEDTRMAALFAGEVHVAESVPWKDYERINEDDSLKLLTSEGSSFMCVMYQTQMAPFDDPAVRYALNWAYDRQAVIDIVFFGQGSPITGGLVPPGLWGHNEALDGTFGYDPEKAKQLLAEAGYPDGFDCTLLSTSQYKMHQTTGEVVQQNLRDIGVNCELELYDWATVVDRSNRGEFQFRIHGLGVGGADPDTILSPSFDSTSGRAKTIAFANEDVDRLLHEARALTDQDERKKLYDEVQQLIADLSPYSLLNYRVDATATTADVRGFERYLVGPSTWSIRRSRVGCSE